MVPPPKLAIGRVITAASARGQGLGRPLMREAIRGARAHFGEGPIHLGAQAHLHDFYASLGFETCGVGYDEDGIPHLPMQLR